MSLNLRFPILVRWLTGRHGFSILPRSDGGVRHACGNASSVGTGTRGPEASTWSTSAARAPAAPAAPATRAPAGTTPATAISATTSATTTTTTAASSGITLVHWNHYSNVIMGATESQITSITIVNSTVYSGADQRTHQSSASLAFVRGIHRRLVNSPNKWPVTRKMFPFDDVIMQVTSQKTERWQVFCTSISMA